MAICGSVVMGVAGGSMWNAPPSKGRNYQMFTLVKNVQVNSNYNFLWYDS